MPDPTNPDCLNGCGTAHVALTNLYVTSAHELIEAVTDPGVGAATDIDYPLGWYDVTGGEIADICGDEECNFVGSNKVTYRLQKEWSNKYGACICVAPTVTAAPPATTSPCVHNKCLVGVHLKNTCDVCVNKICKVDSYCCNTKWDNVCLSEIGGVCDQSCTTVAPGISTCVHSHCTAGAALVKTCNACVTAVCNKDPKCCTTKWDSVCVNEVKTVCNIECNNPLVATDVNTRRVGRPIFPVFQSYPVGLLPKSAWTIPPSGPLRKVTVTCQGVGSACTSTGPVARTLKGSFYSFAPATAATTQMWQVPAHDKVTIHISPAPVTQVYMYCNTWPRGYYYWLVGKFEVESASPESETDDHSILIGGELGDKPFSGILRFPAGTEKIQWWSTQTTNGAYIRFTLAYVAPQ
jgi:hypothetical protein